MADTLAIDPKRTALLPLDFQHDNITASVRRDSLDVPRASALWIKLRDSLKKIRQGIPRDGRVTERAVTLTEEFMIKIGALKARIPYDKLVTHDVLPK
ncbi:MAG: hypothetical protein AUH81_08380 [Candidatus Rokubacteria bacterium 13_1_40CM_4_69_5]|nr:MAG: hypothetical protein AUH81_08380 [Candidatus Rokubacteria bacterium 13_1_40CM_4_69_5]